MLRFRSSSRARFNVFISSSVRFVDDARVGARMERNASAHSAHANALLSTFDECFVLGEVGNKNVMRSRKILVS